MFTFTRMLYDTGSQSCIAYVDEGDQADEAARSDG